MGREFICHRCGRANGPAVENCAYCGLQVGWRPSLPAALDFRRWTAAQWDTAGALSAILAAALETASSLTLLALPLLAVSALLLICPFRAGAARGQERR